MLAILCGTSNAVLAGGYSAGLEDAGFNILNLATGASPSPQAILQAARLEALTSGACVVILDNIINDENLLDVRERSVRRAICAQYLVIADIGRPAICFGLCTQRCFSAGSEIERLHRAICGALAIPFISFREIIKECCRPEIDSDLVFADDSHIRPEISRLLGRAAGRYIVRKQREAEASATGLSRRSRASFEADGARTLLSTSLRDEPVTVCSRAQWTFVEPQRVFGLYIDAGRTRTILEVSCEDQQFYKSMLYDGASTPRYLFVPFSRELDAAETISIVAHRELPRPSSVERSIHEMIDGRAIEGTISVIDVVRAPTSYVDRADQLLSALERRTLPDPRLHILSREDDATLRALLRSFASR